MERLGIPRPPGVALGDRVVHGWNPDGYAALLGVSYRAIKKFSPAELASRLDRVLEAAQKLTDAAGVIATQPSALQLRYLQTLTEIGVERNTVIVFPVPIDLVQQLIDIREGKPQGSTPPTKA